MIHSPRFLTAFLCASILTSVGCGGKPADQPALTVVSGIVTLDGGPASDVVLRFVPRTGTAGNGGFATTGADGTYTVRQSNGQEGVQAGLYDIVFSKFTAADGSPVPLDIQPESVGAKQVLPARYTTAGTSEMEAIVTENAGQFNFDLKSK